MAHSCMAKTHSLATLMALPDRQLSEQIQATTSKNALDGLHLCHELLNAQQYYPTRRGLNQLVGREVERIGQQLTQQPEITQ